MSIEAWIGTWMEVLKVRRLDRSFHWLQGMAFPPAINTAGQDGRVDTVLPELLRHTDASCIAGSTAVGDHIPSWRVLIHILDHAVWQHSYRAGYSGLIVIITGPGAYIYD